MTVKELLGKLQQLPQDVEVKILNEDCDYGEDDLEIIGSWLCNGGYALIASREAHCDEYMPEGDHPSPRKPIVPTPMEAFFSKKLLEAATNISPLTEMVKNEVSEDIVKRPTATKFFRS